MDPFDSKTRPSTSMSRVSNVKQYWNNTRSNSVQPNAQAIGIKVELEKSVEEPKITRVKPMEWTETKLFEQWYRLKDR